MGKKSSPERNFSYPETRRNSCKKGTLDHLQFFLHTPPPELIDALLENPDGIRVRNAAREKVVVTLLDLFHAPGLTQTQFFELVRKVTKRVPSEVMEKIIGHTDYSDNPEAAVKYFNAKLQQAKALLKKLDGRLPKEIEFLTIHTIEDLYTIWERASLNRDTLLSLRNNSGSKKNLRSAKKTLGLGPAYCALLKLMRVCIEKDTKEFGDLAQERALIEDRIFFPIMDIGSDRRDGLTNIHIHNYLSAAYEGREKSEENQTLKLLCKPDFTAETAMQDVRAFRITVQRKEDFENAVCFVLSQLKQLNIRSEAETDGTSFLKKAIKARLRKLGGGRERGKDQTYSIQLGNKGILNMDAMQSLVDRLRDEEGFDVHIESDSNPFTADEYCALHVVGIVDVPQAGKKRKKVWVELQFFLDGHKNEEGVSDHPYYKRKQETVQAISRLYGATPLNRLLGFINDSRTKIAASMQDIIDDVTNITVLLPGKRYSSKSLIERLQGTGGLPPEFDPPDSEAHERGGLIIEEAQKSLGDELRKILQPSCKRPRKSRGR